MATFLRDLRRGGRMLLKHPTFTAAAVISLGLGIGANTTVFTLVNTVFLKPLPMSEPERLVAIYTEDAKSPGPSPGSYPNYLDYRAQNQTLTDIAVSTWAAFNLTGGAEPEQVFGQVVSGNYFDVLGIKAEAGRTFLPREDATPGTHPVAVLSHGLWVRRFGADPEVVGSTIRINGHPFTVVGVTPREFRGTTLGMAPALWVPAMMRDQVLTGIVREWFMRRRVMLFDFVGRLKPGVSVEQAEGNLKAIAAHLAREYPGDNQDRTVELVPLAQAILSPDPNARAGFERAGALLSGVVALVLLIACANVANLLLVRTRAQRREVSIRLSLGARRSQLIRQLLTESLLLALLGGALGLLLAMWALNLLLAVRSPVTFPLSLDIPLDLRVLGFTLLLSLVTVLVFGVAPALRASKPEVISELREQTPSGGSGPHLGLHNLLVVAQVALSLVTLIGAGLFLRSLQAIQETDPGFHAERLAVATFDVGSQSYDQPKGEDLFRQVLERATNLGGVQSAALGQALPLAFGGNFRTVFVEGQQEGDSQAGVLSRLAAVTPGYFDTLGIPLVQGRRFSTADRPDNLRVAIVNETMASTFWPGQEPLAKRFRFHGDEEHYTVVGVVKDSKYQSLLDGPEPYVYYPLAQNYAPSMTLFVRTAGDPADLLGTLRSEMQPLDPSLPLTNLMSLSEVIDRSLWILRLRTSLLAVFALLALALSVVGIFGVAMYSISQRHREIGIRLAMGARRTDVVKLALARGMALVGIGIALGLLVALVSARLVEGQLVGVAPVDLATYAATVIVLSFVALLANVLPARRATSVNPAVALRSE